MGKQDQISLEDAANEYFRRERARTNLIDFIQYTKPDYIVDKVHRYMAYYLEKFLSGEIPRLILTGPPRFGKSEMTSVRLPAYALGRNPKEDIIIASYGADLATSKTKEARDIIESPEFQVLFPNVSTKDDSRASNEWYAKYKDFTTKDIENDQPFTWRTGGHVLAAGVGSGATGFGASLFIIDDYLKDWEQASSPTLKDKQMEWWESVVYTRRAPNARYLIMATRWVTDDLIGRLLQAQTEDWVVIRLPALAESQQERDFVNEKLGLPKGLKDPIGRPEGESIFPSRFPKEYYLQSKRVQRPSIFNAMYQGFPTVSDGNRFKREMFPAMEKHELLVDGHWQIKDATRVRYWDKAATDDGGCYTAGVLIAYYRKLRKYIIEDVRRVRLSTTKREQLLKQVAEVDKETYNGTVDIWIEQEPGSGGKDSAQITVDNLSGHKIFAEKVTGSKDVRLEQFLAQCEFGNVAIVKAPWNTDFVDEFIQIPNGVFRDQSDATGGGFNKLVLARKGKTYTSKPIVSESPFHR